MGAVKLASGNIASSGRRTQMSPQFQVPSSRMELLVRRFQVQTVERSMTGGKQSYLPCLSLARTSASYGTLTMDITPRSALSCHPCRFDDTGEGISLSHLARILRLLPRTRPFTLISHLVCWRDVQSTPPSQKISQPLS